METQNNQQEASTMAEISENTRRLLDKTRVVDLLLPGAPGVWYHSDPEIIDSLMSRFERGGVSWISTTVSGDQPPSMRDAILNLAAAHHWISTHPERYILVRSAADITKAKKEGKIGINFAFQGTNALESRIDLVQIFKRLGVDHFLLCYNTKNHVGDGCHERTDCGLSKYGQKLIEEMNRVGVIVDVTHTGYRTSMDAMDASKKPVVFSHSNPYALYAHERNIKDDQIDACVATGGVICMNAVGAFMSEGEWDVSPEIVFRNIDYVVQRCGAKHAGLGLDFLEDSMAAVKYLVGNNPHVYSDEKGSYAPDKDMAFGSPEIIPDLAELMLKAGYSEPDIAGVLGENLIELYDQHAWSV